MASTQPNSEWWEQSFIKGDRTWRWMRAIMRRAPRAPRCAMCLAPFAGIGGKLVGLGGFGPSRKNPRWCNRCFEEAPLGGVEMEIAVLFADVRGYTTMAEAQRPGETADLMNRFYVVATDALAGHNAVIDKLVGDQVMAFFVPALAPRGHAVECIEAAQDLLRAVGYGGQEPWLPLGVGLDIGEAFIGNVGTAEVKDFTALGDVVNIASRLQSHAGAGQIVMTERFYQAADGLAGDGRETTLELKGRAEPVAARVIEQPLAAR
jgi:adenylate cyclase